MISHSQRRYYHKHFGLSRNNFFPPAFIISSKLHTVKYHSGKKNRKVLKADALVSVPRSLVRFAPQTFRICMSAVPECKHSSPAVIHLPSPFSALFGKSLRPISNSQLRTLLHFHLCPIYLVVFKGSYSCDGISHLEGGFTLRCLQRLSLQDLATLPCGWCHNRSTRGPSTPVLSY